MSPLGAKAQGVLVLSMFWWKLKASAGSSWALDLTSWLLGLHPDRVARTPLLPPSFLAQFPALPLLPGGDPGESWVSAPPFQSCSGARAEAARKWQLGSKSERNASKVMGKQMHTP